MFIDISQKRKDSGAYYELQFCKRAVSEQDIEKAQTAFRQEDSLYFHMDDDERFFSEYLKYFEHPLSPDGSGNFCYFGFNYYTREKTDAMIKMIEKERPFECDILLPWLYKAAEQYNGFFFLGI